MSDINHKRKSKNSRSLRVITERAHPEQVRHYIRALRGTLPEQHLQRTLTVKQIHEIATVQQAHTTGLLIPCKIDYRKGFLKWFGDTLVFIRRTPRKRHEFNYHQIENIILNNQMSFA